MPDDDQTVQPSATPPAGAPPAGRWVLVGGQWRWQWLQPAPAPASAWPAGAWQYAGDHWEWVWQQPSGAPDGGPAAASAAAGTFGEDPRVRPGRVPWGWRQVGVALLIAVTPIVLLTVAAALLSSGSSNGSDRSLGLAVFTLVFTMIVDGWFLFWAWAFSLRRRHLGLRTWGFRRIGVRVLWFLPALVGVYSFLIAYEAVYEQLFGPAPRQEIVQIFPHTVVGGVLFGLTAVVVAPLLEETLFRGFVFQGLAKSWGLWVGALVSGMLFSLSHQQVSVIVPFTVLGIALALLFYYTRSLWTNIALHASFNLIAFVIWVFTK